MSKDSKNTELSEKIKKSITRNFGSICFSGKDVIGRQSKPLQLSPSLNLALRGGIPSGSITLCSGKQKSGKSTSTLSFCAVCQQQGLYVYYLDIEHRLKEMNLSQISGLKNDPEHMMIIQSSQDKILTAEDFLTIAENIVKDHPNCVLVLDSASAVCSEKELLSDFKAAARNDGPKLFAQFCRKISNIIAVNNITVWIIQHLIANTSGWGNPFMEDSGNKLQYHCDTKLRIKSSKEWAIGEKQIGLIVTWQIPTSAYGALPNTEVESYIRFGKGIDDLAEYINLGIEFGSIEKAGAWFEFGGKKCQGFEKLYQELENNDELKQKLIGEVRTICGMDI